MQGSTTRTLRCGTRIASRRRHWLLGCAGVAWLLAMSLAPESLAAESWGYDLSHELMSPYCPGRTLATCPSPQAAELVQWIVTQEAAGATQEQVLEMLIERFGEEILGAPPARGITLWAYIFPVLGFVVGGGIAFVVLRRMVAGGGASGEGALAASSSASSRTSSLAHSASAPSTPLRSHRSAQAFDADLARQIDADLDRRV